jgi:proteic killer suppression protein
LFEGRRVQRFEAIREQAERRLQVLASARTLDDLRALRSNRLEALSGDRQGQFSIRINRQWRICFEWRDGDAWDVTVIDYH